MNLECFHRILNEIMMCRLKVKTVHEYTTVYANWKNAWTKIAMKENYVQKKKTNMF